MNKSIDLSTMMNPDFFKNKTFNKGSVLIFQTDTGEQTHLKITRLNRTKQICFATPITLYTEDEINDMPREEAESIIKGTN